MERLNNCKGCASLIRLCQGLDFFPTDPEVRGLLIERLHHCAKDHQHARAMIDRWLDTQRCAPKVADLVDLAATVLQPGQGLPAGCDVCHGEHWVVNERGAARCGCQRGQALRQMDRRNAQEFEHTPRTGGELVSGGHRSSTQ